MASSNTSAPAQYDYTYDYDIHDMTAVDNIWKIIPPILVILGTVGNILIIVVLIRTSMYKCTTGIYFCALAISDLLGLYIGIFPTWIEFVVDSPVLSKGNFVCKLIPWLTYSVLYYSAWIIVAVTIERVIATFSLGSRHWCIQLNAKLYLIASAVIILGVNLHFLIGMEKADFINYCIETPESYRHFYNHSWPWLDITVFSLLPFAVIFVGNVVILFQLWHGHRILSPGPSSSMVLVRGRKRISTLTLLAMLINTTHFVCALPLSIYLIIEQLSSNYFADRSNAASTELWWAIVDNFMYLNNTFNICLYCVGDANFRQHLFALFFGSSCRKASNEFERDTYPFDEDRRVETFERKV